MNKTKLAILGKIETKFKAPFGNSDFDIWAFNYHPEEIPRVDLWVDIHAKNPNPKAVLTRDNFPFSECHNLLGGNYFNNTASYLIALGIIKGYKEIHLYGMRFKSDKESRKNEYQNVRELIFFAKGRGVEIKAPYDPVMLETYSLYGI